MKSKIIIAILIITVINTNLALAAPQVNYDKILEYAKLAMKIAVSIIAILILTIAVIKGGYGALETQAALGPWGLSSGYRKIFEAFKGPILLTIVIFLIAWLPEILQSIGLLPSSASWLSVNWEEIWSKP